MAQRCCALARRAGSLHACAVAGIDGRRLRGLAAIRSESFNVAALVAAHLAALRTRVRNEREAGSGHTQQEREGLLHGGGSLVCRGVCWPVSARAA